MARTWWLGVCLCALAHGQVSAQQAGSPGAPSREKVEWKPSWHRANLWDGAMVLGGFGIYYTDKWLLPRREEPIWTGPILFDEPLRDLFLVDVRGDRETAADVSDLMLYGSMFHNLIFDNLVVALALHGQPEVAFQMSVANAQAYAVSFAVTSLVKTATGRARPYTHECVDDPEYNENCGSKSGARSFFSGHASTTATGAGLLCAHHTNMPLYDGRILDAGACGLGIAMTLVTAAMRMTSDRHYATDVMMGHLVGFSAGYFVPTLLYYTDDDGDGDSEMAKADDVVILPDVGSNHLGVRLTLITD